MSLCASKYSETRLLDHFRYDRNEDSGREGGSVLCQWHMLACILHVLHPFTYSNVPPLPPPPPPPPPQNALSSSLIASQTAGKVCTCACPAGPSSRVEPDLHDHKAGALAYRIPTVFAGCPAQFRFTYGVRGYSSAALGLLEP
jgi:hypothetical protein